MSAKVKYYSIRAYEWLLPEGDIQRILISYSIADDARGIENTSNLHAVIEFPPDAARDVLIRGRAEKAKVALAFLRREIERAIRADAALPAELRIGPADNLATSPQLLEFGLKKWDKVIRESRLGIISPYKPGPR